MIDIHLKISIILPMAEIILDINSVRHNVCNIVKSFLIKFWTLQPMKPSEVYYFKINKPMLIGTSQRLRKRVALSVLFS